MKDTLTGLNYNEFTRNYVDSFGRLKVDNETRVVYISAVKNNRVYFKTINGIEFHFVINSGEYFDFTPVSRGYYNTPDGAVYVERLCQRQWKKGTCAANTAMYLLSDALRDIDVELLNVTNLYNTTPVAALKTAKKSWAISKHFAVATKTNDVYCLRSIIGKYHKENDNEYISLHDDTFYQELCDHVRRDNLNIEVVV